ncbi:hypothetical protein Taro_027201 [Colocasia esculenta]|uniref:Uncharacterized protein n=1 Tax=Colocasia esculenta TaxID=4460 RepID=A0A843VDC6_COLES|nr:hypothetical protein [Colocasia esculenta]
MTPPADGDGPETSMGPAALGTAPEPPTGTDDGPLQAGDTVLEVATLGGAAEVEMTPRVASLETGGQRAHEIVHHDGSCGPAAAAAASSHITIRDPLEDRIWKEMQEVPAVEEQPCIWRVHPSIRRQDAEAYEPKLISIGPLHRNNKSLLPMEQIKLTYLMKLLDRSKENNILSNYIKEARECEAKARKQYAEKIAMNVDDFVRMLVLDGCFIIEYFIKRIFDETKETAQLSGVRWGFSHLRRDLMLLENQIPFFVLVKLGSKTTIPFSGERKDPLTLMDIALGFLKVKLPKEQHPIPNKVYHLLHLHHLCLNPTSGTEEPRHCTFVHCLLYPFKNATHLISLLFFGLLYLLLIHKWPCCYFPKKGSGVPRMIPCATELHKAGVKFRRKEGVSSYLKVSFAHGILEIPFLRVQESTSSELRNFIALEQCCPQVGSYFTSYAVFMDNIINTENDVAILEKYRIIESKLGNDEEVAKMFNALCNGTHLDYKTHDNAALFTSVTAYCEVPHHRWRASLKGRYFGNPWSIISLVAGILLLFFAAVQSYYTAFPKRSSP